MQHRSVISEKEASYRKQLQEAQKISTEALGHGHEAMSGLESQGELLRETEDTVEANEYTLDKSMKVLRGMTWSGMFYNMFNSDPQLRDAKGNQEQKTESASSQGSANSVFSFSSSNGGGAVPSSSPTSAAVGGRADKSSLMAESGVSRRNEDPELDHLSRNVSDLLTMSHALGDQIEQQQQTLGRIEDKTSRVHDKTLAVTLRSSQLTERASKSTPKLLGTYQFVEAGTAKYLAVVHEDIVWVRNSDRSTYFNCFLKSNNLVALQSAKTLKYLGATVWGSIRASAYYFGKSEECYVELDGRPTGIVFLATNWGGGGWLKQPRQLALQEKLEAERAQRHQGRGMVQADEPEMVFPLDTVTSSIDDRSGAVITVHAVKAKDGEIDWTTDRNKDPS